IGITSWITQRCRPGIVRADARPDFLKLAKEGLGVALHFRIRSRRIWPGGVVRGTNVPACIRDDNTCGSRLATSDIPGILEAHIGVDVAIADPRPGARPVPVARVKLQLELGVGAIAKLGNGGLLEAIKAGLTVIQRA